MPNTFDQDEYKSPNWNIPILKLKLDVMDKALVLDDYDDISEYRDMVIKKMKIIREMI